MHQSQPDIPKVESPHRSCYPRSSTSIPSPSWAPAEPSSSPSTGEQTARSSTTPFFNDWPQHLGSPAVRRGHIYTHISYVPPPARQSRPSPSISPGLRIPAHDPPMLKDPDPHLFHLIPAGARLRCLSACHEYAPAAGARGACYRAVCRIMCGALCRLRARWSRTPSGHATIHYLITHPTPGLAASVVRVIALFRRRMLLAWVGGPPGLCHRGAATRFSQASFSGLIIHVARKCNV